MTRDGKTAPQVGWPPAGGAAGFPALTRLARALLAAGALCLCGAAAAFATFEVPPGGLILDGGAAADLTNVGTALVGTGIVGLAARWPPGAAGRRALAALTVAVAAAVVAVVGLSRIGWLASGTGPVIAIGFGALLSLLGLLVLAGLLRALLWRAARAMQPQARPPLPRRAWWPCAGLGLASLLLSAFVGLLPQGGSALDPVALAVGQTLRATAQAGLGAALLAAVLLCWLHTRARRSRPALNDGDFMDQPRMDQQRTHQAWDADPADPATASLARRLVAFGLGTLVLAGLLQTVLYRSLGNLDGDLGSTVGFVLSLMVPVIGAAALTAGLVGLVLDRSLPLLSPVPTAPHPAAEPPGDEPHEAPADLRAPDDLGRAPAADPDAPWRP